MRLDNVISIFKRTNSTGSAQKTNQIQEQGEWSSMSDNSNDRSNDRTVGDVLNIFRDITGIQLEAKTEEFVIRQWISKGWSNNDFRLVVEYHFNNSKEREFLDKPGNMNLRMILNPARAERLIDILRDLRWKQEQREIKTKLDADKGSSRPLMLLRCGEKIPVGDKESYNLHMSRCFEAKGKCLYG